MARYLQGGIETGFNFSLVFSQDLKISWRIKGIWLGLKSHLFLVEKKEKALFSQEKCIIISSKWPWIREGLFNKHIETTNTLWRTGNAIEAWKEEEKEHWIWNKMKRNRSVPCVWSKGIPRLIEIGCSCFWPFVGYVLSHGAAWSCLALCSVDMD